MADIRRSNGDYCDYVNTSAQPVSDVAIDDLELEVVTEVSVVAVVAEAVSLAAGNTKTQTELKKVI